ncbi:DUF945 domain-containing protein [Flavobacterium psychrophilum]|uniref:DUF932 domain-containing protein n=6 Tax=root TaxID=1 RepID=A6GXR9_FLAPJ|nr:DUF932 domain-containing protein [Flavobacterium psychrophilum]YP_008320432.1 DUF932 domain-containing protein [Flavobacterium phage 6H]YP_009321834.1 DUF932 domain-containing protein [Flavobacterium phage 1H]YP_009322891.1 DUF932 domain-containing protein [Flavobacterium phage 2A]YP_009592326.1 DUF932 domain-containing protein [Flavobacterium phage 23T]QCW20065.1 DUF932 domain-containing protein [Flavobacterium phage FPSV-D15]QCW20220.1 DUF932 domain-containing protein [Flavobacterium pha
MKNNIYFKKPLQNDNIFVKSALLPITNITNIPTRSGLDSVIISENRIVNIVSKSYGHLPNEDFFYKVEEMLINSDINYITRSINRDNRSFAVDYILNDDNFSVNIKNGLDKIRPMLRFTNSYDGSCKTSGTFGFFREVCSNGLHTASTDIGFSLKHRGNINELVLPAIGKTIYNFLDNEFYELRRKFEVLADFKIADPSEIVQHIAQQTKLFKFESSDKNPAPSLNARLVIETIENETLILKEDANMWMVYNAFNELLHGKIKKTFDQQKKIDKEIFNLVLDYVN